jgi:hypothetical protein
MTPATPYRQEIDTVAREFGLDADTLAAQVLVESAGVPWAWNPEPRYHALWHVRTDRPFRAITPEEARSETPPPDFLALAGDPDQEWWAQQASWGLLQIMGAVAREHGFRGPYLTALCDPVVNLRLGGAHLRKLLTRYGGDLARALCAYNGGPGSVATTPYRTSYADKVFARKRQLEQKAP